MRECVYKTLGTSIIYSQMSLGGTEISEFHKENKTIMKNNTHKVCSINY